MHIPDGYLSPSTCGALYLAAAPFWYTALRRTKKLFETRSIPLMALFAAFSFVVMMFNIPLPGGTTGHAVGMAMASIVLGPWSAILAISTALLIQALFFGDGGLTAFGANSFNMAIIGSLVAFAVYRLTSWRSSLLSARRVLAAGLAGYVAMNCSAFCAALEFGIQPLFFRDASGAPLYAPYSLSVALPAMMIGHLTFAGLAEFVLSAGMLRYLQKADPVLLRRTAGRVLAQEQIAQPGRARRTLWIVLGVAAVLTPLGILAVGSAWGEWGAADFQNPEMRRQIATASRNVPPPPRLPLGIERWSGIWNAPLAHYAAPFVRSASVGYLVSAVAGVLLIVFSLQFVSWIAAAVQRAQGRRPRTFLERTTARLARSVQDAFAADRTSQSEGILQALDPRVKMIGTAALLAAVIATHRLAALVALLSLAIALALLSHVAIAPTLTRLWTAVVLFTGSIALPSLFLVPGRVIAHAPLLGWQLTAQGLTSAEFLILRAETASTFVLLLVLCTGWNRLLRALRLLRLPAALVLLLEMVHRYLFVLVDLLVEMLEARQARRVGHLDAKQQRRLAAATLGVLLDKSLRLSEDVHSAMRARGFRGEVFLLDDLQLQVRDWLGLAGLFALTAVILWWGR